MSVLALFLLAAPAPSPGGLWIRLDGAEPTALSTPVQILILLTVLSFLPALVLSMTSFTRLIVVMHFLRQALGTQEMPSNSILIGLSLFLTFFVMSPVGEKVRAEALAPALEGRLPVEQAIERSLPPLREFMRRYTREKDLALFLQAAGLGRPDRFEDIPTRVVVPAFIISELETAFRIGFVVFLPFLVIDMVVATVLLSMGTFQMPPVVVSMPLKVLLFVLVDGWNLVVGSLLRSF